MRAAVPRVRNFNGWSVGKHQKVTQNYKKKTNKSSSLPYNEPWETQTFPQFAVHRCRRHCHDNQELHDFHLVIKHKQIKVLVSTKKGWKLSFCVVDPKLLARTLPGENWISDIFSGGSDLRIKMVSPVDEFINIHLKSDTKSCTIRMTFWWNW